MTTTEDERWDEHRREHERIQAAHDRQHDLEDKAVEAALASQVRETALHTTSHAREHVLQNEALQKAERAADIRFTGVNEFREQLRDQATRLSSTERVDTLAKDMERQFTDVKLAITNIEKGDVKGEGKSLGQGAVIAVIVGAVGFSATLLGLIVVVSNLLTTTSP